MALKKKVNEVKILYRYRYHPVTDRSPSRYHFWLALPIVHHRFIIKVVIQTKGVTYSVKEVVCFFKFKILGYSAVVS
jgi:hypothetical protein